MPTTSNFGWTTPADTDLVKDGASAIRTLGNGVDTSMAQLKGGTTGQILSKTNGTDMAFTWINNDQGDITGVTAGTGISGGGTSGTVTITNDMATAIDAKGDLIAGTAADTYARLAVGTNGQVLTADSTTATGLKWATSSSLTYTSYTPTFSGFTLGNGTVDAGYLTLDQIILYHGVITFGSTSSFTGALRVSVPVNIKAEGGNGVFFIPYMNATLSDTSATLDFPLHCGGYSATQIAFVPQTVSTYARAVAANYVEGTIPVTIATNDQISWMYAYRKA